jgi:hypothetical protein
MCVQKIGIEKGEFFHRVYAVQERLGRVLREVRPHPLFPIDEYFGGVTSRRASVRASKVPWLAEVVAVTEDEAKSMGDKERGPLRPVLAVAA